jgi:hypothetical protein
MKEVTNWKHREDPQRYMQREFIGVAREKLDRQLQAAAIDAPTERHRQIALIKVYAPLRLLLRTQDADASAGW